MLAWTTAVLAGSPTECTAYTPGVLGGQRHEVRVTGDLVFAQFGLWWNGVPPPLYALGDDRTTAYGVVDGWRGPRARRRPRASLDTDTLEIRGRGVLPAVGGIDLEAGEAWLGATFVRLEGPCTPTDALLAVLGSRKLRTPLR